jgi:putative SOS response-associated peptidase YedK
MLAEEFGVDELAPWLPRYNIAPSQAVVALLQRGSSLVAANLHWGLVPAWAKDRKIGSRLINSRAETVAEKPSFRSAFRKRRCLVLADGYYEWVKVGDAKQPYHIYGDSHRPFAFAGLWETWSKEDGSPYSTCSIITCPANNDLEQLHHRMPVVLENTDYASWLTDGATTDDLIKLLRPAANGTFNANPVSTFVNSPAHEGPDCITHLHS